jgi:hypothetical protein
VRSARRITSAPRDRDLPAEAATFTSQAVTPMQAKTAR